MVISGDSSVKSIVLEPARPVVEKQLPGELEMGADESSTLPEKHLSGSSKIGHPSVSLQIALQNNDQVLDMKEWTRWLNKLPGVVDQVKIKANFQSV